MNYGFAETGGKVSFYFQSEFQNEFYIVWPVCQIAWMNIALIHETDESVIEIEERNL